MKPRKTKTILETHTYNLGNKISYKIEFKNGQEIERKLVYSGGKHLGYDLIPVYNPDLSLLEHQNPCVSTENWQNFDCGQLLDPELIDLNLVILVQWSTHLFYDVNLEPVPVLVLGNYIDAGIRSGNYDLTNLHKHLSSHPQVKKIGKIELIPYYNNNSSREKHFEVSVLPTKEQMKILGINRREIFYQPWYKHDDFLGMKPFRLPEDTEE